MSDFDWSKESVPVEDEFDWTSESVPASEEIPEEASAIRGALSGIMGKDFAAKVSAGADATLNPLHFSDTYSQKVKEYQDLYRESEKQNPQSFKYGGIGGQLAAAAALGGSTLAGSALAGGAAGALHAAGDEDVGMQDRAKNALVGGGVGALGGAAGYGLGQLVKGAGSAIKEGVKDSKLGNWITGKLTDASDDALKLARNNFDKPFFSASGRMGGDANAVLGMAAKAREALADPMSSEAIKADAQAFLANGTVQKAVTNAYENLFKHAPQKISALNSSAAEFAEAAANRTPEAVENFAGEILNNPVKNSIMPAVKKYVGRIAPTAIGGYVGSKTGGTEGAIAGSLVGSGVSAVMGRPGTAISNLLKNPGVREVGWNAAQKVLVETPELFGRYAKPLLHAASQGPAAAAVTHYLLSEKDPEYRETFNRVISGNGSD